MIFTKSTFKYFDLAKKNSSQREWFEKNKKLYEDSVKLPIQKLLLNLNKKYQKQMLRIQISPDKISRPLRPKNRAMENGVVKS